MMRRAIAVLLLAAACATPVGRGRQDPAPQEGEAETPAWAIAGSAAYYALPDEPGYLVPVVTADRDALHLEARYQYEDRETASAWAGWNFGTGDELRIDATLLGGVVGGRTQGVAPGYRLALTYGRFDLFAEGEYLVSTEDHEENFFYSWTELGVTPLDWLRIGAVGQRTKIFENEPFVDRGLFAGVTWRELTLTAYAFNFDDDERFFVFSFATEF